MGEADARARIAAQASEEQRRAIADVLLDNSGSQGELVERARDLWYNRVLPLAHNIRTRDGRIRYRTGALRPGWPDDAHRIMARLRMACGPKALRVDHIGSTAVPGMDGKDVIDVQVIVESLDIADELADPLATSAIRASKASPATWPMMEIRRCGANAFTEQPIQGVRQMCIFEWAAGPISGSRCCSSTG